MKKRQFYSDRKRNKKWTEEPKGHAIDFADKYIGDINSTDKFDKKRPTKNSVAKQKKKELRKKRMQRVVAAVLSFLLIGVGYTGMDVYMQRHAVPMDKLSEIEAAVNGNMSELSFNLASYVVDSISLDASVMLSSVMGELNEAGFSSLTFDAKRADGTIGYQSSLVSIDTYSAISSPATRPATSIKALLGNDILPVARICCWKDNVVPSQDKTAALMNGNKLYKDGDGNTYLNPNSSVAYNYIKDIITECYSYGVTVFLLYGCSLPDDVSGNYNDGFSAIAKKLNNDLDGNVKLLQAVEVEINGKSNSEIKKDIKKLPKIKDDQIYYIKTKTNAQKLSAQLLKRDIQSYIIED